MQVKCNIAILQVVINDYSRLVLKSFFSSKSSTIVKFLNSWAEVVAQRKSACLVTEELWVQILLGAGLFSLLSSLSSASLIQVP